MKFWRSWTTSAAPKPMSQKEQAIEAMQELLLQSRLRRCLTCKTVLSIRAFKRIYSDKPGSISYDAEGYDVGVFYKNRCEPCDDDRFAFWLNVPISIFLGLLFWHSMLLAWTRGENISTLGHFLAVWNSLNILYWAWQYKRAINNSAIKREKNRSTHGEAWIR